MDTFLNSFTRSDKQFLVELMVGGYILSFIISFIGSFPVGIPPASMGTLLEAMFTTLTLYSAIVSAWLFYLVAEHIPQTKTFMVISFIIVIATSFLLISANVYFRITPYMRSAAILVIGLNPLISFVALSEGFSEIQPEQKGIVNYLLITAVFLLSWGIHTALQPFWVPDILKIGFLSIMVFLYNMVALANLILAAQFVYREDKLSGSLLLPSLVYVTVGASVGYYLQRNAPESFRLFEMIISEPWRWAIGYDMPLFSQTYNYLLYLVFPAAVLPFGWVLLKQVIKTHASSWQYVLYGWILLFVCGAGSSDAFEMIGKLIGYSLLLFGFLTLLSTERR